MKSEYNKQNVKARTNKIAIINAIHNFTVLEHMVRMLNNTKMKTLMCAHTYLNIIHWLLPIIIVIYTYRHDYMKLYYNFTNTLYYNM